MTDIISTRNRSLLMASVKTKNTAPERRVQKILKKLEIKYRSSVTNLPGKPDIKLLDKKAVLFVHGCFWHSHRNCGKSRLPVTNKIFWIKKINANVLRDQRNRKMLKKMGWKVITVWECETKSIKIEKILYKRLLPFAKDL